MFDSDGITKLFRKHRKTIADLDAVGEVLRTRFHDMEDAVECVQIAALSGEAMVMIGPPGTAKSRLVRSFCHLVGLIQDDSMHKEIHESEGKDAPARRAETIARDEGYFEYLLTQFTEPSELFGFFDLNPKVLQSQGLVRRTEGMMQQAQVVFLDEVFNASSAILNALLTFMNERRFHDRGQVWSTPLQLLFAATNHPPQEPTLAAVFDRFLLRCYMSNVAHEGTNRDEVVALICSAWSETHATSFERKPEWANLLPRLEAFRNDLDEWTESNRLAIDPRHELFPALTEIIRSFTKYRLSEMSNRRLVKLAGLMLAIRMLRAHRANSESVDLQLQDLDVILRFSLDQQNPSVLSKITQNIGIGERVG